MKKYFFVFAALLAIAAVSCQKETAITEKNEAANENQIAIEGVTVFSAKMPEAPVARPEVPASRTVIGEDDGAGNYTPLWTATDSIVVNGVKSAEAELIGGGTSAKFSVAGVVDAPYLALYPASKAKNLTYDPVAGTCQFLVSGAGSPQDHLTNGGYPTFDPSQALMAAYSTDENLAFHHLCVYYKITVNAGSSSNHDNIRYVYIRQGDGSLLAGVWTATYVDADHINFAPTNATSAVTLDCGEAGIGQGIPMIVAVPAYNYSNGLYITIKDVNGHFCTYKMDSSATQFASTAGTIYEFNPAFNPGSGTIKNEADWEEFATAINSGKDFQIYRWVGDGTVKLGADINTTTLTKITGKFPYTFDGQGHTITRSAGTGALFRNVWGTVKNLKLAGAITSTDATCAALADTLYNGGRISNCRNDANISVNGGEVQTGSRAAGIVGIMTGGMIDGCVNNGSVTSSVNCTNQTIYNLQIGGIVGQVDGTHATAGDVVLYNCSNTGDITADPVFTTTGHGFNITYTGVGGIAGWLRGKDHSFVLNNCDNSGTVFYSAEHVTDPTGTKANSISVGGIVGLAGDQNGANGFNTNIGANGLDVTMRYCDNSGTVHNCGINYATTKTNNKRVYTGGIMGSLVGTSGKYAKLARCRNTGTLLTYDLTGTGTSSRPLYCQVVGGLIGYGGYVAIDSCKVNCTIGNGIRQSCAIGGAIGHTMAPFAASRDTVWFTGYFVRLNGGNHINSSSFATVVKKWSSSDQDMIPSVSGSSLANCRIGATLYYYDVTSATGTDNYRSNCLEHSTTLGSGATAAVRGYGYNDAETIKSEISFSSNTTLNSDPDLP